MALQPQWGQNPCSHICPVTGSITGFISACQDAKANFWHCEPRPALLTVSKPSQTYHIHTHTHTPQALAFVLAPSLLVLLTLLWPFLSLPGPANNHCLVSQGVFPHGWHSQQQPPSAHSAAEGLSRAALSGKRRQAHTTRDIFWTHSKQDLHIYNPLAAF